MMKRSILNKFDCDCVLNFHYKAPCTMCSMTEDVQYESGTSSVQARMCNTNQAHRQYKQGCAVQASRSLRFGRRAILKNALQ